MIILVSKSKLDCCCHVYNFLSKLERVFDAIITAFQINYAVKVIMTVLGLEIASLDLIWEQVVQGCLLSRRNYRRKMTRKSNI